MSAPHPASCTCREHPLPDAMRVREARDRYLAENGFTLEGYEAKWTEASVLGIPFVVPNTRHHAWAIRLHDLHHVATGYGTDIAGEGEVSAWEARGGLRNLSLYVRSIVLTGAAAGLLVAPRRALGAARAAARATNLFSPGRDPDALLDLTVGELRASLGVPPGGLARRKRRLHARAPRSEDGGEIGCTVGASG